MEIGEKILLDTSAYSAFKRGHPEVITCIQKSDLIFFTPIVLGELFAGFKNGQHEKRNRDELAIFLESPRVVLHPLGSRTSEYYASTWLELRKKGKPLPTNDIWIAASVFETGSSLVTLDQDFLMITALPLKFIH